MSPSSIVTCRMSVLCCLTSMLPSVPVTLVLLLAVFLLWLRYMSSTHGLWKSLGVPGAAPWPVVGNFVQELKNGLSNWHRKQYMTYKANKVISTHFFYIYFLYSSVDKILSHIFQTESCFIYAKVHFCNSCFISGYC